MALVFEVGNPSLQQYLQNPCDDRPYAFPKAVDVVISNSELIISFWVNVYNYQ